MIEQTLYGWGSNSYGQLSVSSISFNKNIIHPKLLPLPDVLESGQEQITQVKCGKRHSYLLTDKGSVWVAGNVKMEKAHRLNEMKKQTNQEEGDPEEVSTFDQEIKAKNQLIQDWKGQFDPKRFGLKTKSKRKQKFTEVKDEQYREKNKTKIVFDYQTMSMREKRLKHNQKGMKKKQEQKREENKMINDQEASVKHRWVNLSKLRGGTHTIIPNQLLIHSILLVDSLTMSVYLAVGRKFTP